MSTKHELKTVKTTRAQLRIASTNVRGIVNPDTGLYPLTDDVIELAQTISSKGLLQNLLGYQTKDKLIHIVAGGRRLTAIDYAIQQTWLPDGFPIDVKLIKEDDAELIGLIENTSREEMTPAKELMAYRRLQERGYAEDDIAAIFGKPVLFIRRRLCLTLVEPRIFTAFEEGRMSIEALKAFAVTNDHDTQIATFEATEPHFEPNRIRNLMTETAIAVTKPIVRFLGVQNYTDAGGRIQTDLFSENAYVLDRPLLEKLVLEALHERSAPRLSNTTYSKVDYLLEPFETWQVTSQLNLTNPPFVELPIDDVNQAIIDKLTTQIDDLEIQLEEQTESFSDEGDDDDDAEGGGFDDDGDDQNLSVESSESDVESPEHRELQRKIELLTEQRNALLAQFTVVDPRYSEHCVAVVFFDRSGELMVKHPLISRSTLRDLQQSPSANSGSEPGSVSSDQTDHDNPTEKTKPKYSSKLLLELTANHSLALQAELINHPHVALALLAYKLFNSLHHPYHQIPLGIQTDFYTAYNRDSVTDSKAQQLLKQTDEKWQKLLINERGQITFSSFLELDDHDLDRLLSYLIARSLNVEAVNMRKVPLVEELTTALSFNMASYWEPTSTHYFNRLNRKAIIDDLTDFSTLTELTQCLSMKKGELVYHAERKLSGKGWLPDVFQRYVTPVTEVVVKPATESEPVALLAA